MADPSRVVIYLPPPALDRLRDLAGHQNMSLSATVRQALGVLQVMREANRDGLYVGTSRDREALDTLIVAP